MTHKEREELAREEHNGRKDSERVGAVRERSRIIAHIRQDTYGCHVENCTVCAALLRVASEIEDAQ